MTTKRISTGPQTLSLVRFTGSSATETGHLSHTFFKKLLPDTSRSESSGLGAEYWRNRLFGLVEAVP